MNVMARADPVAKSSTMSLARFRAKRSYHGCLVTIPRYSAVGAMSAAPRMKAAIRMCVWTRTAIATFLPMMGTPRSPIGILYFLLVPAGEVDDPADRQEHVQHDSNEYQKTYGGRERPLQGAMARFPIEPRHREQQDDEDRRHHHGSEADQSVAREEHEHLLVEEEEPFRPGYVRDGRGVRRVGERRGREVREHDAGQKDQRRDDQVVEHLRREEAHGLVRALVDILLGDYLFFGRLGLAGCRVHLYTSLLETRLRIIAAGRPRGSKRSYSSRSARSRRPV